MTVFFSDTFNAFDRDGNAELGWSEYLEAWKFLNQPGSDEDIKRAFDAVDVDGSQLVEFDEFVFSIMGEAAGKYGPLAEMQTLGELLQMVIKDYTLIQGIYSDMEGSAADRAKKNAQLRARLENVRKDVSAQMNELFGKMMNCNPEDLMSEEEINKHLSDAFHKFDEDNSGQLGQWEFTQAWFFLGLKGTEEEISEAFKVMFFFPNIFNV